MAGEVYDMVLMQSYGARSKGNVTCNVTYVTM